MIIVDDIRSVKDSEVQDILVECAKSSKILAKTLFPDRFFSPFSSLHDEIFDLIDSNERFIAIAAPRGMGKTSIVGLAKSAQAILFRQRKFIPYVSNSQDAAMLQTENLKRELISNKHIRKLFGPVKTKNADGMDEAFSKKSWVGYDNTLVMPRGAGQQIRGVLFDNARPDLIIVDDFEDPETIENDLIRAKTKSWFYADLLKAVSRVSKNYQIIYIDTLKHEDALIQDLLDSNYWTSIRLEICDDNYEPTAPEFFTKEDILREVELHREQGILDVFYREYRNLPISTEDAVFSADKFRYYSEDTGDQLIIEGDAKPKVPTKSLIKIPSGDPRALQNQKLRSVKHEKVLEQFREIAARGGFDNRVSRHELLNVVIGDPAKTDKLHSADSAVVGVGVHPATQRIFLRDVVSGKFKPDQFYDEIFAMTERLNAFVYGVEVTGLNEYIEQPLLNEARVRGIKARFEPIPARGKKEMRIAQLAPYYNYGYIYHNRRCTDKIEGQLLSFPRSKLWDVMDAFAYIIYIMDKLNWMFDPSMLGGDGPDAADDYSSLRNEPRRKYRRVI